MKRYDRCDACGERRNVRFTGSRWLCRMCWAIEIGDARA